MKRFLLLLPILLSAGCTLFLPKTTPTPSPTTGSTPTPTPTTVSTPPPTGGPAASPTGITVSDEVAIKQAMATKYSKSLSDVDLTISKITANHAWGSVKFAGEIAGGWFLAAKVSSNWIIVADGNGTINCPDIEPYNFPVDMVPECYDPATSTIIHR